MQRKLAGIAALLVGAIVVAGCSSDDTGTTAATDGTDGTAASAQPAPAAGEVVFEDPLDDDTEGWGVFEGDVGSNTFDGGDYVWDFESDPEARPHFLPDTLINAFENDGADFRDVVVRASVTQPEGEATVGVMCRETADTDSDAEYEWYEFVVNDGFAAIRRTDTEGNIDVLAETDEVEVEAGAEVTLEGACVDDADGEGQLWFTLDDELILDATDADPLPNGVPGLVAYAVPDSDARNVVRWQEFSVFRPEP